MSSLLEYLEPIPAFSAVVEHIPFFDCSAALDAGQKTTAFRMVHIPSIPTHPASIHLDFGCAVIDHMRHTAFVAQHSCLPHLDFVWLSHLSEIE